MKTTLNKIKAHKPCGVGYAKLLRYLKKTKADDDELTISTIAQSNGLLDVTWCLRAVDNKKELRLFAVFCARQVQHLLSDPRSVVAINVAERFAHGQASEEELTNAYFNAYDAYRPHANAYMYDNYAPYGSAHAAAYMAASYSAAHAAYEASFAAASSGHDYKQQLNYLIGEVK